MDVESTPAETAVVVGSLHYDLMVDAPDRPRKGETVTGSKWYPKFGGKGGNQAVAASQRALTRFVGAVGTDGFSDFLLEKLAAQDISAQWITKLPTSNTGMSIAITDTQGDYGAVIVSGANAGIDPDHITDPLLWSGAKILVLQNEIPEKLNYLAALEAKKNGVLVCLNAAPYRPLNPSLISLLDILVVNALEAEDLSGIPVNNLDMAKKAAIQLAKNTPMVVVTAGGDGVALASRTGDSWAQPANKVELVSTHGAGDVFVGTFCALLASGCSLKAALKAANDTAAIHVSSRT